MTVINPASESRASLEQRLLLPSGIVAETVPRGVAPSNLTAILASGTLQCTPVVLQAGDVINTITVSSGTTALSAGSNQWACLIRYSDRAVLEKSADDTSAAWAAEAYKTFTLATTVTIAETAVYVVGLCVVATTPPTLRGVASNTVMFGDTPMLAMRSSTGLTNPASLGATAGAFTAVAVGRYYAKLA